MNKTSPYHLIRRPIRRLHPYVPGEQPKIKGLVKLNTNENPYPPSPYVLAAVKAAVDGRLRLYPNPTAQPLRDKLAKFHGCGPENIIVGNGSDELLAMATRAFVEPVARFVRRRLDGKKSAALLRTRPQSQSLIQFFTPSYSLYPVLAAIHGATANAVPLNRNFRIPPAAELRAQSKWDFRAALTYITTPNAPSGCGYSTDELESLCRPQKGVVILDEAYVDFANGNALKLALQCPHVIVSRTFSKAYSLCFQRIGYFVGHPELIAALDKIRDSYNVNGLGQLAALVTLDDLAYYQKNFERIVASRAKIGRELTALGFRVFPSQTNFLFVRPPVFRAEEWQRKLRVRKILVRWFDHPGTSDYLRISIGREEEMAALLKAARAILWRSPHQRGVSPERGQS
jgi:histidinol-phosphate aminotransferase